MRCPAGHASRYRGPPVPAGLEPSPLARRRQQQESNLSDRFFRSWPCRLVPQQAELPASACIVQRPGPKGQARRSAQLGRAYVGEEVRWRAPFVPALAAKTETVAVEQRPSQIGRASCRERVEISVV